MCVNPASASLVDGINKCKNHKSLSCCLCMCVCQRYSATVHLFTCACTWLACVIGVKSISPVVAWKTFFKLQHIYLTPPPSRSDLIAENVINTADGVFVIVNALGEMKPIPDRCVYGVPWCRRISQLFTGDHNYRLRNQEMCPPPLLFFMNYRHYFYLHVDRGGICVIYSFAFPLFWNFTLINSLMVSNDD